MDLYLYMLYAYERCIWSLCKKWNILRSSTAIYIICQMITATMLVFFRCSAHERMWMWFLEFFQFPPETGKLPILFIRFFFWLLRSIKSTSRMLVTFSFRFLFSVLTTTKKKSNKRAACIFIK